MSEFFIRLQQRKLVQWAIAYVAFAFALLQGIDIVAQRFAWPESVERILILALCVGFFVALVLAWYHGERGAQRVSSTELVILALLLAIGGGLLWRFAPAASPATRYPVSIHTSTRLSPKPAREYVRVNSVRQISRNVLPSTEESNSVSESSGSPSLIA